MSSRWERQVAILEWVQATFGERSALLPERTLRFLEEALELVQAIGLSRSQVHDLVDYVYRRVPGRIAQETGQVAITLLALAEVCDVNADEEEEREWDRIRSFPPTHFRVRHNAKADAGISAVRAPEEKDPT